MSLILGRVSWPRSVFGLLVFGVLVAAPQEANGQLWLQTARVVSSVENGPVRVLLDSLAAVAERKKIDVKRSPDADAEITVSELQEQLINEEGIGIGSANHVFIDYRFTIASGGGFEQQVAALYFVFRPGPNQNDIPILYLDARTSWVKKVLENKGTDLQTNQAALIPFRRHLGFAHVARHETTQIVELGGETIREGFEEKKEALIQKVQRLVYDNDL